MFIVRYSFEKTGPLSPLPPPLPPRTDLSSTVIFRGGDHPARAQPIKRSELDSGN